MLTSKELLQIDATLIAGILVLISIIATSGNSFEPAISQDEQAFGIDKFTPNNPKDWAYFGGGMFGISALLSIFVLGYSNPLKEGRIPSGIITLSIGAMGLGLLFVTIGFLKFGFQ